MQNDDKEILKYPKLGISKRDEERIQSSGGTGINSANPDTPSYQVKDNARPKKLPQQQPPQSTNNN